MNDLNFPGGEAVPNPVPQFGNLASLISLFLNIAFFAAVFLTFYFLIWGAFQYIMAKGDKESLAKARARITWAIVGLLVVLMAYFVAKYAAQIFPPQGGEGALPF